MKTSMLPKPQQRIIQKKRELINELPNDFVLPSAFKNPRFVTNGILAVEMVDSQWSIVNGQFTLVSSSNIFVYAACCS